MISGLVDIALLRLCKDLEVESRKKAIFSLDNCMLTEASLVKLRHEQDGCAHVLMWLVFFLSFEQCEYTYSEILKTHTTRDFFLRGIS